jgi:hypothetical protein
LLTTGHPPFLHPVVVVWGGCRVGLGLQGGLLLARTPGVARLLPCVTELLSWACAGPLPRAWDQLNVDCVLLLGGVAGAGTGCRRMPSSLCLPAIGGLPH